MMEGKAYGDAVEELRHASGGRYTGPATQPRDVRQALDGVEGIDPHAIRQHLLFAVGSTDTARLGGGWLGGLLKLLQHLAFGLIGDALGKGIREWWRNREEAQKLTQEAEKATEAIRDICRTSDTAVAEILSSLSQNVAALSNHLRCLPPHAGTEQAAAFNSALRAGATIIDQAGCSVMKLCQERDSALSGCMEELERRVSAVCEAPQPSEPAVAEPARAAQTCDPSVYAELCVDKPPANPAPMPSGSSGESLGPAPNGADVSRGLSRSLSAEEETTCAEARADASAAAISGTVTPAVASEEVTPRAKPGAEPKDCSVFDKAAKAESQTPSAPERNASSFPMRPSPAAPFQDVSSPLAPTRVNAEVDFCEEKNPCAAEPIAGSLASAGEAGLEIILNGARLGAEMIGEAVEGAVRAVESAVPMPDCPPPCPSQLRDEVCENATTPLEEEQPLTAACDSPKNTECVGDASAQGAPWEQDRCSPQASVEPPQAPEALREPSEPASSPADESQVEATITPGVDLASVPEPAPPMEKLAHQGQQPGQVPAGGHISPVRNDLPVGQEEPGLPRSGVTDTTGKAQYADDAKEHQRDGLGGGIEQKDKPPHKGGARKAGKW